MKEYINVYMIEFIDYEYVVTETGAYRRELNYKGYFKRGGSSFVHLDTFRVKGQADVHYDMTLRLIDGHIKKKKMKNYITKL